MIHLIYNWYVDSDGTQYILKQQYEGTRKNKETGEQEKATLYRDKGFFSSMRSAVEGCLRKALMDDVELGDVKTLTDFLQRLHGMRKEFKKTEEEQQ